MGWFAEVRKRVALEHIGRIDLDPSAVWCQYNPESRRAWLQCTDGYRVAQSPHYRAACNLKDAWRYERYCLALGHTRERISSRFLGIADMIRDGIKEPPSVLLTPLVVNEFNQCEYEIWEGHHRMASALIRGGLIACDVYRWSIRRRV